VHAVEQTRHEHERRDADQHVDRVRDGAGSEDLGHDVRIEQREHGPVQAADDEQGDPDRIEPLEEIHHASLLARR
jgi:hypothetical protein